ncbi:MAG TPA: type I methionyl aminopeptidase [bacterium]|nr:type I methionyl aminopeptidase [bacterium]HOL49395.1 type I methionyl aminopeptidase [bacterium]HPO51416.1 type I methionyl aminopeptidase [bacterium]
MGVKRPDEIEKIRSAGKICKKILLEISNVLEEGKTTLDIADFAELLMEKEKVKSAFRGYRGYPGVICISINEEVVHGIPSKSRYLRYGDIVSLDVGVVKDGYIGDCAITCPVGEIDPEKQRLIDVTRKSLELGISKVKAGCRTGDIGSEIQRFVEKEGFNVVRDFAGHGVGKYLHEEPDVPNFGRRGKGFELQENMVIAIEPMVNMGKPDLRILSDGWTVVTRDGLPSAHFEDTVLVKKEGFEILTNFHNG